MSLQSLYARATAGGDNGNETVRISPFAFLTFLVTVTIFLLALAAISYTYAHLITTLCMVESPSTQTYVPIGNVDPDSDEPPAYSEDGTPKPLDSETGIVRTVPLTSSLRLTVAHLKAKGGFAARFRGLGVYLCWSILRSIVVGIFSAIFRNFFMLSLAAILAEVALANIHMTWIHVIISEPSTKKWYRRLPQPAFRSWRKIAPAVAFWAISSQAVSVLPMLVAGSFGTLKHMQDPDFQPGTRHIYSTASQLFLAMFLTVLLFVSLQIPATVAMVRVAASMLPEEDETIVPFDRTFGGMTTPEIVGGQGKIGIVEAWRSFNWECRRRLLRTVAKVALIIVCAEFLFVMLVVAEAHILFGDNFGPLMKSLHGIAHRGGN